MSTLTQIRVGGDGEDSSWGDGESGGGSEEGSESGCQACSKIQRCCTAGIERIRCRCQRFQEICVGSRPEVKESLECRGHGLWDYVSN